MRIVCEKCGYRNIAVAQFCVKCRGGLKQVLKPQEMVLCKKMAEIFSGVFVMGNIQEAFLFSPDFFDTAGEQCSKENHAHMRDNIFLFCPWCGKNLREK